MPMTTDEKVIKENNVIACFDCGEHLCAQRLDGLTCPYYDPSENDDK